MQICALYSAQYGVAPTILWTLWVMKSRRETV